MDGEKEPLSPSNTVRGAEGVREVIGDGVFGGHYQVDDSIMQEMFDAALGDVIRLLEFDE